MPPIHQGRFVWRELVTADPSTSAAFYGQLFGWSQRTMDMGEGMPYTMLRNDLAAEDVAGSMKPMMDGVPNHWLGYLTVDDVDASVSAVPALGGTVLAGPFDIPVGRFAVVADPTGATVALFKSTTPGASDTDRTPPDHTFCWGAMESNNLDAAVPFYTRLIGWDAEPMGEGMVMFKQGEVLRATGRQTGEGPSHWLQYVAVDDCDAGQAKASSLGATVLVPSTDMPGMGRFCVLADPAGAVFALWKDTSSPAA